MRQASQLNNIDDDVPLRQVIFRLETRSSVESRRPDDVPRHIRKKKRNMVLKNK